MTAGTWRKHLRFQASRPAGEHSASFDPVHLCTPDGSCHTLFICGRSPPAPNGARLCATCEKNDAPYQITGFGPRFGLHRGGGGRPDAARQGSRGTRRAAVRRHRRDRLRQGFVVRTRRRKMRITGRHAIRPPIRHVRGRSQALHCPQARQKFSTGLWLQQQNLFERLLPACLSRREIARWKVLMDTRAGSLRIDSPKPHNARIGRSVNPALSQLSRAGFTFCDGSAFALQSGTISLWTVSPARPIVPPHYCLPLPPSCFAAETELPARTRAR
jgi:hypothetical protein